MFWDQESETLARPALEQLQLKRLQAHRPARGSAVCRSTSRSLPNWASRRAPSSPLADVRRLPFTTGADLRAIYPDGLLAVPRDEPVRLHTSSGTTGKPKALFFSRKDVDNCRRTDRPLPGHDGHHAPGRLPEHDELRPVHRRAGHALRRREGRLPGHSRRPGHTPSGS